MKELVESLYTKLVDNLVGASGSAGTTAIYNTIANQAAVFPYLVFSVISDVQDFTFTEDFEDILIQLSIFDDDPSSETVLDIFEEVKSALDKVDLSVDNYHTISMLRDGGANLTKTEEKGKLIWSFSCTYRILLQVE